MPTSEYVSFKADMSEALEERPRLESMSHNLEVAAAGVVPVLTRKRLKWWQFWKPSEKAFHVVVTYRDKNA